MMNPRLLYIIMVFLAIAFANAQETKYIKENLGPGVNSKYEELVPIISMDGKTLYICRQFHPDNLGVSRWNDDQDIWYSTLQSDGTWSEAVNMGAPLNNFNPNAVCGISSDGNSLLVFGIYEPTSPIRTGVSISFRKMNGWSLPTPMLIDRYYNRSNFSTFFISGDGKYLMYSIERDEGYGERDIYISFRLDEFTWSKPLNLGNNINTALNEDSPYLAADNTTLYFASEGRGGYGKRDIFFTKRLDDTWTNWSEPVNMGPDINTAGDDYHFRIPASGDYAYMVSNNPERGDRDIYRIKLVKEKPDPVVLVYGKTLDLITKKPVQAKIHYEILPEGKEAGTALSSPVDGKYSIVLYFGKRYAFRAEAEGYYPISDYIDLNIDPKYKEVERNLYLAPISDTFSITLKNIYFEFDKYVLMEESFPELNRLVAFLKQFPGRKILIEGHTDNMGTHDYNIRLSQNRAQSVAEYLIGQEIAKSRISTKGYGATQPMVPNDTDENRAMNRRVVIRFR